MVDICTQMLLLLLQIAWATGSVLEALLALLVMTSIEHEPWRWLLGLSALPLLVVMLAFPVSTLYSVYNVLTSICLETFIEK